MKKAYLYAIDAWELSKLLTDRMIWLKVLSEELLKEMEFQAAWRWLIFSNINQEYHLKSQLESLGMKAQVNWMRDRNKFCISSYWKKMRKLLAKWDKRLLMCLSRWDVEDATDSHVRGVWKTALNVKMRDSACFVCIRSGDQMVM